MFHFNVSRYEKMAVIRTR